MPPTRPTSPTDAAAFDLRDSGRRAIAHRVQELLGSTAGSPGALCHTVVPKSVLAATRDGQRSALHPLADALDHEVQRRELHRPAAAEALYTPEGKAQVRQLIDHYLRQRKGACAKAPALPD